MKTHSKRFTDAVMKLYNAFHNNELIAFDCQKCAVGSIVDGNNKWAELTASYILKTEKPDIQNILNSGYSAKEIRNIERIFMFGRKLHYGDKSYGEIWNLSTQDKEEQNFKGLCAVVEYLCELEGIPNIMDYTALFKTENDAPKHQLEEVFV